MGGYGQGVVIKRDTDGKNVVLEGVLRAVINASSAGDNEIVAATAGRKIKVISCFLIASGVVSAIFKSDTGGSAVAITGTLPLTTNSGFVLPAPVFADYHWFESAAGKALTLNLNGATSVGGCISYYLD